MAFLQKLKKYLRFDTNLFEMVTSITCMIIAGFYAFFNRPTNIPLSPFNVVMVGTMMGFVVGYFVSTTIISIYKNYKKRKSSK